MDHMSHKLKQVVGIGCFSVLLQFSAAAQNASSSTAASMQEKTSRSETSLSNTEAAYKSDAKSGAGQNVTISSPKVNLKNPSLNFNVMASESKMDARTFAMPDMDGLGEPQAFQATAYALKGRTRTGTSVRRGVIAADPQVLPLGSVVQLRAGKYSGVYTVHDTGKRIRGNVIDVWVPDRSEARQFGRRKIQLHVLKLGPQRRVKK